MTTKELIMMALGAALSTAFKFVFERIFSKFTINTSKAISWIKKSLYFSIRYALPIFLIMYLYRIATVVDKLFVVFICFNFLVLGFNLASDYTMHWVRSIRNSELKMQKFKREYLDKQIADYEKEKVKKQSDF